MLTLVKSDAPTTAHESRHTAHKTRHRTSRSAFQMSGAARGALALAGAGIVWAAIALGLA